ncbi:hypothetical protein [Tropicimonas sp. IMCC6043]|uniref:hypothetical protein n=1 Tax=Tropicimonas sp. IMCC6043 TaxID=2510645 RepID=UPI0013E9E41B|nr:hypothetical protein [Tropicimonas sp. IMCC6043]
MRFKLSAAILLLCFAPAAAIAQCAIQHNQQSVSQCPEGASYDVTTGTCVQPSTS